MERLAKRARDGDRDAFVALMEACKPSLLGVARSLLKKEEDVADAMQDTVLDAFENLSGLKNPGYCKTWLTRILLNNCYDILRQKKTVTLDLFSFREEGSGLRDEGVEYEWDSPLDVRAALGAVSESDRLILILFYVEDMSQKDIAGALGISVNAVKQRLQRAKRHFKQSYEKGAAVNE